MCGTTSATKTTTIVRPKDAPVGVCTYIITGVNANVCQLRIDFNNFTLAQPTNIYNRSFCYDEEFIAGDVVLCGENGGQHSTYLF